MEGRARRRRRGQPGARRDRDREVAGRAAVAVRRHRRRAARRGGRDGRGRHRRSSGWIPRAARSSCRLPATPTRRRGRPTTSTAIGRACRLAPTRPPRRTRLRCRAGRLRLEGRARHLASPPPATARRRRIRATPRRRRRRSCRRTRPRRPRRSRRIGQPGHREAADPQARQGPGRRPHAGERHRARRRGHPRRRHPPGDAGERVPQHRDAGVGRSARGAHPGQGRAQGDRGRDGVERVHRPARERVHRRRRDPHDGVRQAAEDLARLRRRARLPAARHGEGRHLGGAPQPDGQLAAGPTKRSSSTTT